MQSEALAANSIGGRGKALLSAPLIRKAHHGAMVFTPEQYRQIAESCDAAATDHTLAPAKRHAYARRAEWYRTLARLGDKPKWARPGFNIPELLPRPDQKKVDPLPSFLSAALRSLLPWQKQRR
jgi:hypothetical protein